MRDLLISDAVSFETEESVGYWYCRRIMLVLDDTPGGISAGPNWNPSRMCNREQSICNN
jgi:hypothetical protein